MKRPAPQDDALVAAIDRAVAPYVGIAPPELVAAMRAALAEALTASATGSALLRRAAPGPVVAESGEIVRSDLLASDVPGRSAKR
jgi:hypothetical protein